MLFDKTKKCVALMFALVCPASAGLLYAQPAPDGTPCVGVTDASTPSNVVPCYFDVSFTLTENLPDTVAPSSTERFLLVDSIAWNPGSDDVRAAIETELEQFAESWCIATAGLSRINRVTLYTDGRPGDFRLINHVGRAAAFPGGFRYLNLIGGPSIVVYRHRPRSSGGTVSNALSSVAAHELAHSALKIYDEYMEDSASREGCHRPRLNDDERETIMNRDGKYQRFSVVDDYEALPTPQTAQYRCHKKSAWEALVQPPTQDAAPAMEVNSYFPRRRYFIDIPEGIKDNTPKTIDFGEPVTAWGCPQAGLGELEGVVTWASDARRIVMLIDNSGSMRGEPADTAKDAAQRAVNTIAIEHRPIQVAVVEFSETASTQADLTMLGHRLTVDGSFSVPPVGNHLDIYTERILEIHRRINNLSPHGGTDFQAALALARTLLASPGDAQGMVIMLSDGQADTPDTSYFRENDVPVYTVGIGEYVDAGVLREIAADTGGAYDFVDDEDLDRLPEIFENFLYGSGMVDNNQLISSGERSLAMIGADPPAATFTSVISGVSESANFVMRWKDGATLERFTLTRPDGAVVDEAYATSATGTVAYLKTPVQASYSVRFPSPGVWTVRVEGDGDFSYEARAYSLVTAGINAGAAVLPRASKRTAITYPEPIPISVNVEAVKPVVGADAVAEITQPDGTVVTLDLRDDGESPDETMEDGVYSGLFGDYAQDGAYEIEAVVHNLEGRARIEEEGASSGALQPAPLFQRIVRTRVEVVGAAGKRSPPPTSDDPVGISPDGALHWGSIERPGQVNWYRFTAAAGTTYWLQTSHLAGHDGVEMATRLELYESDAATEIDSSVHYRQTGASSIEWTAPADGVYLVSVSHADEEGRGIYGLTVGRRNVLSEAAILRSQRSGGGGSVGWPLLLSLLAAAFASGGGMTRKRTRR